MSSKLWRSILLLTPSLVIVPDAVLAQSNTSLGNALLETKPILDVRLRYETVDEEGFAEDADALTYRLRAGFETSAWYNFRFAAEIDHVQDLAGDFNSTTNGNTEFPVIADPNVTELNRLQLSFTGIPQTKVTLGRQRINLDDQRFVGSVGWRQDDQTVDAILIENTSIKNLKLDVTYIDKVNTIFGDDGPRGQRDSESVLINAKYSAQIGDANFDVTGFSYLLDFDDAPALSSQTYGILANFKSGPFTLKGSIATQADYASQPIDYTAEYYLVEAGYKLGLFTFGAGYEELTGNGTIGFSTPLATLHKFNGFDDQFLTTPPDGLEDIFGKIGVAKTFDGPIKKASLTAIYHDFSSDEASAITLVGDEIDLVGSLSIGKFTVLSKYSNFFGDGLNGDRQRFWFQIAYRY